MRLPNFGRGDASDKIHSEISYDIFSASVLYSMRYIASIIKKT